MASVEREGQYGKFWACPTYGETKCKEKQVESDDDEWMTDAGEDPVAEYSSSKTRKTEEPDWDAINRGKVRCQVAVAYIQLMKGDVVPEDVVAHMEEWVDYIMDGPKG